MPAQDPYGALDVEPSLLPPSPRLLRRFAVPGLARGYLRHLEERIERNPRDLHAHVERVLLRIGCRDGADVHAALVDLFKRPLRHGVLCCPVADRSVQPAVGLADDGEKRAQPCQGVAARRLDLLDDRAGGACLPGIEHRLLQGPPVLEMPVKAALGHRQRFGQALDAHRVGALGGQRAQPRVDPLLPAQPGRHRCLRLLKPYGNVWTSWLQSTHHIHTQPYGA